jgi:predicted alpha/beta-fold hydrolase
MYRTLFTNSKINFNRKRIQTPDNDFIDLDFSKVKSKHLALLIHGLEGSSNSKYILSTTQYLNKKNIDVVVFNLRGCSGEPNNKLKSYHSGETKDLDFVVKFLTENCDYNKISIVGFSLGGNMSLKYLSEKKKDCPAILNAIVAVSPPCDLKGSSIELAKKSNFIYMKRFLKTLTKKAFEKNKRFPNENLNIDNIMASKNFADFDNLFTAPTSGFESAEDYWLKASSLFDLEDIKKPTYLISAENDPFLSKSCIPFSIAKNHKYLFLEAPKHGGHIGFIQSFSAKNNLWLEKKVTNFIQKNNPMR